MNTRYRLIVALASASLVLAGCGDKGNEKDAQSTGVSTTKAPNDSGSAAMVDSVLAAQGTAKSSHVSMAVEVAGQTIEAEGDIEIGATAAETKFTMTLDSGSANIGPFEIRLIGETLFLNLGPMSQGKFTKVDLGDASNPIGAQYGELVDQLDPTKQLQQFKTAMKSMTKKGVPIEIDGVRAQPYEVVLDTSKIPDVAGTGADLPKELTYTMWIGPDDLPRRIATEFAGAAVTMNYSAWGEEVDISAPPKDQITEGDFLKQFGKLPGA